METTTMDVDAKAEAEILRWRRWAKNEAGRFCPPVPDGCAKAAALEARRAELRAEAAAIADGVGNMLGGGDDCDPGELQRRWFGGCVAYLGELARAAREAADALDPAIASARAKHDRAQGNIREKLESLGVDFSATPVELAARVVVASAVRESADALRALELRKSRLVFCQNKALSARQDAQAARRAMTRGMLA